MKTISNLLFLIMPILLVSACSAPRNDSAVYSGQSITTAQHTITGNVVSKRIVLVSGDSGIGKIAGAAIGAIAGGEIGGGDAENTVGSIAGAIVGGTIGASAEDELLQTNAVEYIVETAEQGLLTIILNDDHFRVGDDVFVILGNNPRLVLRSGYN